MSNLPPQDNATARANQAQHRPDVANSRYVPTKEEMKVLDECQTEATYRRGIPLGILVGLGALKGTKSGFLKVIDGPLSLLSFHVCVCVQSKSPNEFVYFKESRSVRTVVKYIWFQYFRLFYRPFKLCQRMQGKDFGAAEFAAGPNHPRQPRHGPVCRVPYAVSRYLRRL